MMFGQWLDVVLSLTVLPVMLPALLPLAVEFVDLVDCSLSTVSAENVTRLDPDERDDELDCRSCSNGS